MAKLMARLRKGWRRQFGLTLAIASIPCWVPALAGEKTAIEKSIVDEGGQASVSDSERSATKHYSLSKHVRAASRVRHYETPTAQELRAVERLFETTFLGLRADHADQANGQFSQLQASWLRWEMQLERETLGKQYIYVLSETAESERGRGFYVFNPDVAAPVVIESPHSFFDQHTRTINLRLFESGRVASAAWNTTKRSQADLAHRRFSYMNAYTTAFANSYSNAVVFQLHGFSQAKRSTVAAQNAGLVISDGTRNPSDSVRALALLLQQSMHGDSVLLFPAQCGELGGTTNAQGRVLRALGANTFIHLEMNKGLRERLRENASERAEFLESLLSVCRS